MITNHHIHVDEGHVGVRLDRFVGAACPSSKRALIAEAILNGQITVNGNRTVKAHTLDRDDAIVISQLMECTDIRVQPNADLPLTTIYQDNYIIALNKPAGMPVHPIHHTETGTLANALVARFPELQAIGDEALFPALVHRIDTQTSGIVIAARTEEAYGNLRAQFSAREATKVYVALVAGRLASGLTLKNRLAHDTSRRGKMLVVDEHDYMARGEQRFEAISDIKVVEVLPKHSLVQVTIHTGITHQIRCQLAHAGYPIVGDTVYGAAGSTTLLPDRHFLHAASVALRHPRDTNPFRVEAPLPSELMELLEVLRKKRR